MHLQCCAFKMLFIQKFMHSKCYAVKKLCIQNVMHSKCYKFKMLWIENVMHSKCCALKMLCIQKICAFKLYAFKMFAGKKFCIQNVCDEILAFKLLHCKNLRWDYTDPLFQEVSLMYYMCNQGLRWAGEKNPGLDLVFQPRCLPK